MAQQSFDPFLRLRLGERVVLVDVELIKRGDHLIVPDPMDHSGEGYINAIAVSDAAQDVSGVWMVHMADEAR